jgi:hypothetical protein
MGSVELKNLKREIKLARKEVIRHQKWLDEAKADLEILERKLKRCKLRRI